MEIGIFFLSPWKGLNKLLILRNYTFVILGGMTLKLVMSKVTEERCQSCSQLPNFSIFSNK